MSIIKFFKTLFTFEKRKTLEELYLEQAHSLQDLERRQREIQRNAAPWQTLNY